MKIIFSLLFVITVFTAVAQPPIKFKYQGIARGANGNPLSSQFISLRITLHRDSDTGPIIYRETQTGMTNQFGAFSLEVGDGLPVLGTIANIPWGRYSIFQEVEMDVAGGSNYVQMGTSQLLSVPYALSAANSGFSNYQVFNASGNFIVPAGVSKLYVEAWGAGGGGGGGGGGGNNGGSGGGTGGGGGGGGYFKDIFTVSPGNTLAVVIGTAGAGGSGGSMGGVGVSGNNGSSGISGGNTSFNGQIAFGGNGGNGGNGGPAGGGNVNGGNGGAGGGGQGPLGQVGQFGQGGSGGTAGVGFGGNAAGGGGFGGNPGGDKTPGGGGSGGVGQPTTGNSGSSGGVGRVVIWW